MKQGFDSFVESLEKPLRFACRGVEHLLRVRDIESTLARTAERARQSTDNPRLLALLAGLLAELPQPDAPAAERLRALTRCLRLVEQMSGEASLRVPSPGRREPKGTLPKRPTKPRLPAAPALGGQEADPTAALDSHVDADASSQALPLDAPVQFVKGVGPKLGALLAGRGLHTVGDLVSFYPRRYEARHAVARISEIRAGTVATVEAEVLLRSLKAFRGRRSLDVMVGDGSGVLQLRWFRVPGKGFAERFKKGVRLRVSGPVKEFRGRPQMVHPEIAHEEAAAEPLGDAVVPVYSEIEPIRPAHLRRIVASALPSVCHLDELLPSFVRERHHLPPLHEAVAALHRPPAGTSTEALERAQTPWHRRLIYQELLLLELAVLMRKAVVQREPGFAVPLVESFARTAQGLFAFALTGAQSRALAEMEADLLRAVPMQRLLQGDVGSGKTAVALTAAVAVARAGLQTAIMAPTEILAEQHAQSARVAFASRGVHSELLTSATSQSERRRILGALKDGTVQVLVGTHALIQDDVHFARLALAIVDEQHRFGVLQRAALLAKGRASLAAVPHMLVMTATPIPRTLALTVYGDLDLSVIDEMPPGRTPVQTQLFKDRERQHVYGRVRRAVQGGRQAYVVFPLVEESEGEGMEHLRDATSAAEELASGALSGLKIGLLHGRLDAHAKDSVMRAFAAGELQVLVATTVIEVGIDVPNATVMVVEHAERFGLSQLHQLRGRVGRGAHKSECLLVAGYTQSEDAWQRLAIMEQTTDGFRIAEEDLHIRGPGDFLGTRQSGLPLLQVANLLRDQHIMLLARADAEEILAQDPELSAPENSGLRRLLTKTPAGLSLAQIG